MVACLAVMVLLLFGNVALRYLFNSGINVSDELSRLAFVWMIFLGRCWRCANTSTSA